MGDVWLARNAKTEALVALKLLHPRDDEKLEIEERFRREARLAGVLGHRSIVRIFDFLEEPDGTLVLVMELLRGETLEHCLTRRGPMSAREAMAMMSAVLSALEHGHQHHVVHRDVKPANIFLAVEPDGRVIPKLLDYGIAKVRRNDRTKTVDGVVLGTPSYMSPEQIRSDPAIDGRSDLFSCAVVFYEAMTGVCPFNAVTPSAAIAGVLESAVDPDPRIEPKLWLEVQRALSKRPMQRHAGAGEMRSAMLAAVGETEDSLASVLGGVPKVEEPSDPPAPVTVTTASEKPARGSSSHSGIARRKHHPWMGWAIGGAALGILGATVALSRGHAPAPAKPMGQAAAAIAAQVAPPAPPPVETGAAPPAIVTIAPEVQPPPPAPRRAEVHASAPSHAARPPSKPRTPKPIATSPGF
jgi:serine/threonine-protein kinase